MLDKATIRSKLISLTAIFLVLMIALGGFAINRMSILQSSADDLSENWLAGTGKLLVYNSAVDAFRRLVVLTLILAVAAAALIVISIRRRLDQLTSTFETKVGALTSSLAGAATEMEATAGAMTGTAGEASQRTVAAAAATEQASANVQTV